MASSNWPDNAKVTFLPHNLKYSQDTEVQKNHVHKMKQTFKSCVTIFMY